MGRLHDQLVVTLSEEDVKAIKEGAAIDFPIQERNQIIKVQHENAFTDGAADPSLTPEE